ncbi:MAG: formate C-acetyltransferase/glycerol dehydratase family glycyl radical enzyme [Spirochaetes bacterium]|nr:formate C-acetyltransferase/glycerol dehydratase family glycyl radical enzyme [Spirochaetota bacterium]
MSNDRIEDKLLHLLPAIDEFRLTDRNSAFKSRVINAKRFFSVEQALLITESYKENENKPKIIRRALGLANSLRNISISIEKDELITGNRSMGVRDGIVFPEAGISWIKKEIDSLPSRDQDSFNVRKKDRKLFFDEIVPYWEGKTLEDFIFDGFGDRISTISKVVKINQKDHAQGHIIPDVAAWLSEGPQGIKRRAEEAISGTEDIKKLNFLKSVLIALNGSIFFIKRYSDLAFKKAGESTDREQKKNYNGIGRICKNLSEKPAETFREALQSVWFLFIILHLESNASSFSPGRADQYLFPYFKKDIMSGELLPEDALELIESLFINFNKIVYMRNYSSAKYFAGFPIGFNITIGGQTGEGKDAVNLLTYLFLKAQEHLGLPQPNLTARLHKNSADLYIDACSKVIGLGSGMPQIVNDESIIPSLERIGISKRDAFDYALVGCVELSTQGNNLGWSDAAMFNLLKVLELTLNNGVCLITGDKIGLGTGTLTDYKTFDELLKAYKSQLNYFIDKMITAVEFVDRAHAEILPSPFLSSVVNNCIRKGLDVTAGGAFYNLSGIQAIQVANIADSLAVLKQLVFDEKRISKKQFLDALRNNWRDDNQLRQMVINHIPKYGNDVEWVDNLGAGWVEYFSEQLEKYKNCRGGIYHMGLYTVSAHIPMGENAGASPDGRVSGSPLADGGMSAMYGRDRLGPTAVLKSISRINSLNASNGALLNMKFLPSVFKDREERQKFNSFLKTFVKLKIHHIQFNVVSKKTLLEARKDPEKYRNLTIRVAGYTAYFTELASDLQQEIIKRTAHEV